MPSPFDPRPRAGLRRTAWLVLLLGVAACARTPVRTIQVQGTVHTVGSRTPIPGAEVTVEWPTALGAGQAVVTTDGSGRFAVGRTRRVRPTDCAGIAITVLAAGFSSAYTRHTADCGDGVLTFDLPLLPQIR